MQAVVFAIHLIVSLALVGVILLQRSEGGALGIGGGNSGVISGRGAASVLTRSTAILAGIFFVTSLTLAALGGIKKKNEGLDLNAVPGAAAPLTLPLGPSTAPSAAPQAAPLAPAPSAPAIPAPQKSSALELAPKPSAATAAPATKPTVAQPKPAPETKPSIPAPTPEPVAPVTPAGPSDTAPAEASGGGGGPQPR